MGSLGAANPIHIFLTHSHNDTVIDFVQIVYALALFLLHRRPSHNILVAETLTAFMDTPRIPAVPGPDKMAKCE